MMRVYLLYRLIGICSLLFLLLLSFSGSAKGQLPEIYPYMPQEFQRIYDRGALIVGLYFKDDPPYFMEDEEGELYGVDIELAKGIAKELNVEVRFCRDSRSYMELTRRLLENEFDLIISKYSQTFERATALLFSRPYVSLAWSLIIQNSFLVKHGIMDHPIGFLQQSDVTVAVYEATSYVEFAKSLFPMATLVEFFPLDEAVHSFLQGDLTVIFHDEDSIMKLIRQYPNIVINASIYVIEDREDHLSIALPRTSEHLMRWINIYLDTNNLFWTIEDLIRDYPEVYR